MPGPLNNGEIRFLEGFEVNSLCSLADNCIALACNEKNVVREILDAFDKVKVREPVRTYGHPLGFTGQILNAFACQRTIPPVS